MDKLVRHLPVPMARPGCATNLCQIGTQERLTNMTNAYRTIDGTDNNPLDPTLGQSKDQLLQAFDSDYSDGISSLAGDDRPSPREISNEIFS